MDVVTSQLERLFGQSHNGTIVTLLKAQGDLAVRCARIFRESRCSALKELVALEHEGDLAQERVHEIIDSAFILRFDKSDLGNLASRLDNILDGMRQVAMHMDTYRPYIQELRPEADDLLRIIEEMTMAVQKLIVLLNSRRLKLGEVKRLTRELKRLETEADTILHHTQVQLVKEYAQSKGDAIAFIAHDKAIRLLEHVTDVADHCGSLILSIARKEA